MILAGEDPGFSALSITGGNIPERARVAVGKEFGITERVIIWVTKNARPRMEGIRGAEYSIEIAFPSTTVFSY